MDNRVAASLWGAGSLRGMLHTLLASLPTTVTTLAAEAEAGHVELPIPALGFGIIALVLFASGLVALWSFRGTAYVSPDEHADGDHEGASAPHGRDTH